jgi:hypothetical protein
MIIGGPHMNIRMTLAWALALAVAAACGGGSSNSSSSTSTDGGADAPGSSGGGDAGHGGDATATSDGSSGGSDANADAWAPLPPTPAQPQLWYYHNSYLSPTNASEPAASEALIDQAVAAGYTGLAFWDSALTFANRPNWSTANLATVVQYAQSKGLAVLANAAPIGYSNDMLQSDMNQAEGAKIVGGQFTVTAGSGGNVLQAVNSLPPIQNGGFEGGQTVWFGTGDPATGIDTTVAHTGSASGVIHGEASGNARLTQ